MRALTVWLLRRMDCGQARVEWTAHVGWRCGECSGSFELANEPCKGQHVRPVDNPTCVGRVQLGLGVFHHTNTDASVKGTSHCVHHFDGVSVIACTTQ